MFTGIIERPCSLLSATPDEGRTRLWIDLSPLREQGEETDGRPLVGLGDSVAVNGCCLTVAARDADRAGFDVIPESLSRTNLGDLTPGARVNVERAMRYGDRIDGHLVQGHVETTGELVDVRSGTGETRLTVACGADFARRCLPKGSVTVDGVSLTVAELHADRLVVALVPHTLALTNLGQRRVGDRLNLEPDMVGQWVLRLLQQAGQVPGA